MTNWFICQTIYEPSEGKAFIRECRRCGISVLVPDLHVPDIEAGTLKPSCWECHRKTGKKITIHPTELDIIQKADLEPEAWAYIEHLNEGHPRVPSWYTHFEQQAASQE
jgi:hypothetical protein